MKFKQLLFVLLAMVVAGSCETVEHTIRLEKNVLGIQTIADSLDVPWEICWGPDERLWITEQGGLVSAIDPDNGIKKILLEIPEVWRKRSTGLLGMALHPDMEEYPFVIVAFTMLRDSIPVSRLVRYRYEQDTLIQGHVLLEIPGSTGHNGSRIVISKDGKIFWATGDIAKGENAQDLNSLNGKILRLNLDGSIPGDNPYPGSYVYAHGFRNMQGLTEAANGMLYTSEHGDATDDEVNLIQPMRNYGWPLVQGYADTPEEERFAAAIQMFPPLKAWTPTIAPAGITYYKGPITEWNHSLLLTTLKAQSLYVLRLSGDGNLIEKETVQLPSILGRLRAICTATNGDVYLATSNRDWNPPTGFPVRGDDRIVRLFPLTRLEMMENRELIKAEASLVEENKKHPGQVLYNQYCVSCHKQDGKGVPGSFPALAASGLVNGNAGDLIRFVWNGSNTEPKMPAFNFLKEEELAVILSYIRSNWNNQSHDISKAAIKAAILTK